MSAEFWAIIGVGTVLWLTMIETNRKLDHLHTRLQNFWEEWLFPTRHD